MSTTLHLSDTILLLALTTMVYTAWAQCNVWLRLEHISQKCLGHGHYRYLLCNLNARYTALDLSVS